MINIITNLNQIVTEKEYAVYGFGYDSIEEDFRYIRNYNLLLSIIPTVKISIGMIEGERPNYFKKEYINQLDKNLKIFLQLFGSPFDIYIYVTEDEFELSYIQWFVEYIKKRFNIQLGIPKLNISYKINDISKLIVFEYFYKYNFITPQALITNLINYNLINMCSYKLLEKACGEGNININDIGLIKKEIPIFIKNREE